MPGDGHSTVTKLIVHLYGHVCGEWVKINDVTNNSMA